MVILVCVHSHEIPEKTHLLLLSQACQAKLGMTKRVRDGSITVDDYDAQSSEVARQVGTGRFMIRIDHLVYDDYVCNPLQNDLFYRLTNSPDCFTHVKVNVRGCEIPRNVLQADSIAVSCGLANFEQSSWSTHHRHEFWVTHERTRTKEDHDEPAHSPKDNLSGMCNGRSIWTIDCRKFDDPTTTGA